jgi:flagellar motility protein MotE (MotC chaperone)
MSKSNENELEELKEKSSRFQSVLFVVIIPLLFAVTVTLVVLTVAGVNVFDHIKSSSSNIPVVSNLIDPSKKQTEQNSNKKVVTLQANIKDRESQINQLKSQLDSADQEKKSMELQKKQLQQQIDELKQIQEKNKRDFKEIVSTYETMSAKNSAPIILNMTDAEAVKILSSISPDVLSQIMAKMPPVRAAKYTELLSLQKGG